MNEIFETDKKNPEIAEIIGEVNTLLNHHAETLGHDINNLNKKEGAFVEWVSENAVHRPVEVIPNDPTYSQTVEMWDETRKKINGNSQEIKENIHKSNPNRVLSDYYNAVVPKIQSIINSTNRSEDEEKVNQLMEDYTKLQRNLERDFSKRTFDRKALVNTLKSSSQEATGKRGRLYKNFFDNRKVMDAWNSTAIAMYTRRLIATSEDTEVRNSLLDNEQNNILHYDNFLVNREKMSTLLVAMLEKKYGEKAQ